MKKPTLILLAAAVLMLAGCSLKEPGSPSWQVQMTVPIADRDYTLTEIVSDSSEVDSLGNWISISQGNLVFNLADSLVPAYIDGELSYEAVDEVVDTYVGVRTVDSPGAQSAFFLINQLAPQIPIGLPFVVPPFNFSQSLQNLGAFEEYDWAFLAWGGTNVTVTNNFPMPVDGLTIEVMAIDPPLQVVHLYVPGTLNPGESVQFPSTLPISQQIDNNMDVVISGQTPGTTTPVVFGSGDNIQVDVALSDMGVTQALAHLAPQSFVEDTIYHLEENNIVRQANIREGSVSYQVENLTELVNVVTFSLPDFCHNGQPFSEQTTLMPHQSFSVQNRSLVGYELSRPQGDNMIRAIVTSDILDTGNPL
jgi:hypothetical protein